MTTPNTDKLILQSPKGGSGIPYILFYRQGSNPYPQFFLFFHESSEIRKVVDRIKKHCELMNLRFINVRPFVVDLDEAEGKAYGTAGTAE